MQHPSKNPVLTTAVLGGWLAFGLAGPVAAETSLEVENDGLVVSAFVSSSKDVLSTNIRVVGPDGFVFEDRVEDSSIQWIPEGDLADGLYHWEAWTVTVKKGAPARDISAPQPASAALQNQSVGATSGASDEFSNPETTEQQPSVPVERYYDSADKNVQSKSGSFRVKDGWLDSNGERGTPLSKVDEPNMFQRAAGGLLDLLFPSAHAQTVQSDNIEIENDVPPFIRFHDTYESNELLWDVAGWNNHFSIEDIDPVASTSAVPFRIDRGAATNALRIAEFDRIGFGTFTPTTDLHIADNTVRIRLEDTGTSQSWYVKNRNAGRFEIGEETNFSGVFTIDPGAPRSALAIKDNGNVGIGTDTPAQPLHVVGNNVRIEASGSTWEINPGGVGLWFNQATPGSKFGVLKLQNDAPVDSIVANSTGVGIGTDSPGFKFHSVVNDAGFPFGMKLENINGDSSFVGFRLGTATGDIDFNNSNQRFRINIVDGDGPELDLDSNGDLAISGTLSQGSSRHIKTNIVSLSGGDILEKLSQLVIAKWSYTGAETTRHAGPMAEDFFDIFGLGPDSKHIAPGDMAGLSLAAVKALYEENQQLKERLGRIEQAMLQNSNF